MSESKPSPPKGRHATELTNPDRVYWQDAGVTKQGLADYYVQVWPLMRPFMESRPLALLRCPEGASQQCFFQKHAWKGISDAIVTFDDPLDNSDQPLVAIDSLDGLLGLVQAAALEIHPWQSSLRDLEHPDQIVMDLDPGEGVEWPQIVAAANEVRRRLSDSGLASFVKTSGGKGLHVVAPLRPRAGWDAVKGFAKGIADDMAAAEPEAYVATVAKAKRVGRVLVDYLRNGRNQTAIAPYATRARAGAPVAMPLAWEELSEKPIRYTVADAPARIATVADPWRDFRASARPLAEGE
ncbi:MAG: non-homologous end-joining DNA ligase [Rhizobiaceae bacterium]|nr:non-homologous end-joining DNA ligase [Rhizobiaceae bacterium]